jgi:hypothetical protein
MGELPMYQDLDKYNLVEGLARLHDQGWSWSMETDKITCKTGWDWNHPWVMIRREPHRNCMIWYNLLFGMFDAMPPFCLNCWKVVAKPKTIVDVFKMVPIMFDLDLPSKIGVSRRLNTMGMYQAYFYNDSLERAKEVENIARKAFSVVDPEMEIFTKRFCTEFEERFGPSDKVEVSEECLEKAQILEELIDFPMLSLGTQPKLLREKIMKRWIMAAMQNGDETYLQLTREHLDLKPVKY